MITTITVKQIISDLEYRIKFQFSQVLEKYYFRNEYMKTGFQGQEKMLFLFQ